MRMSAETYVANIDVDNAFLQSENGQRIIMAMCGKTTELLVRLNPELYRQHLHMVYQEGSTYVVCAD